MQSQVRQHLATNHGVIARHEALDLGMTSAQVRGNLRSGRWTRIGPEVYRLAGAPATWWGSARAITLSSSGLLSHRAAARAWQLDGFDRARLELTVPIGVRRGSTSGVRWHRSTQFQLAGELELNGVSCTGIGRTVLDLAGKLSERRLDQIVDEVLRRRMLTWPDLFDVLVRHQRRGRPGVAALRALLDRRYGEKAIPDSRWNRMVGQLLVDAGLPAPLFEYDVRDAFGRFCGRLDLAFPEQRVGIELDSRRFHLNSQSFHDDRVRSNRIVNAGWRLLHFTWEVYADRPQELVRDVRTALASNIARSGAPEMPTRAKFG